MPEVKVSIRQRHALLTRTAIAEAARELFGDQGYVATTIEQIASGAGVAPSTVYAVYGTKAAILAEIRWRAVSDAGVPRLEELIKDEDSAPLRLKRIVSSFRQLYEQAGDVFETQRAAAAVDAGLARNWHEAAGARREHMRRLMSGVKPQLRHGLSPERAGDVLDAMVGFEMYQDLVGRGGWTPAEYEDWLVSALGALLLD